MSERVSENGSLSPSRPLRVRHRGPGTKFNTPGPSIRAGYCREVCSASVGMVAGSLTNTHARTAPAAGLRANEIWVGALAAAQTQSVSPWHGGEICLKLKASPLDRKGVHFVVQRALLTNAWSTIPGRHWSFLASQLGGA